MSLDHFRDIGPRFIGALVQDISLYSKLKLMTYPLKESIFYQEGLLDLFKLVKKEYERKKINRLTPEIILREYPNFNLNVFHTLPDNTADEMIYVAMDDYCRVIQRGEFENFIYKCVEISDEFHTNPPAISIEQYGQMREKIQEAVNKITPLNAMVDLRPVWLQEAMSEYKDPKKYGRIPTFLGSFQYEEEGVKTWVDFDSFVMCGVPDIEGALTRNEIHLIGGNSGSGKTTVACQIAAGVSFHGQKVLYLTMEQSEENIRDKILGFINRTTFVEMQTKRFEKDKDKFFAQRDLNQEVFELYFGDRLTISYVNPTPVELEKMISVVAPMYDVIILDNFQNVNFERGRDEVGEAAKLSNNCSKIIKDTGCCLIFLTQVTIHQNDWANAKPFGSSKVLQDAATFLLLHKEGQKRKKKDKGEDEIEKPKQKSAQTFVDVLKNRQSAASQIFEDIPFSFNPKISRIGNFSLPSIESIKSEKQKQNQPI
jgi:KaiC/GvpD/RAD55 family RecA-like ATPase